MEERDKEQALIHGTGVKIGRVHNYYLQLDSAREQHDYFKIYHILERMYAEVEAYLNPDEKKISDMLKELSSKMELAKNNDFNGVAYLFELKIRRVMARIGIDMQIGQAKKKLKGGINVQGLFE